MYLTLKAPFTTQIVLNGEAPQVICVDLCNLIYMQWYPRQHTISRQNRPGSETIVDIVVDHFYSDLLRKRLLLPVFARIAILLMKWLKSYPK